MHGLHLHFWGLPWLAFVIWMAIDSIRAAGPSYWLWIIIVFQPLGPIIYFLVNKLPELPIANSVSRLWSGRREINELRVQIHHMDRAYHWAKLGDVYRRRKEWDKASEAYREALKRDTNCEEAHFGLGLVEVELGHFETALEQLRPLVANNPRYEYGAGLMAAARAEKGLGHIEQARADYETLMRSFAYPEVQYEYAEILYQIDGKEEARRLMDRLVADGHNASGFKRGHDRRWGRKARAFLKRNP